MPLAKSPHGGWSRDRGRESTVQPITSSSMQSGISVMPQSRISVMPQSSPSSVSRLGVQQSIKMRMTRASRFVTGGLFFDRDSDSSKAAHDGRTQTRNSVMDRLLGLRDNSILNNIDFAAIQERHEELQGPDTRIGKFVHSTFFGFFCALVILGNAIQIGLETDYGDDVEEGVWQAVNVAFLLLYSVELALRFAAGKSKVLKDRWFMFDLVIVLAGACGMAAAGVIPGNDSVVVLRALKLCRVVRIFRLFRFFDQLWLLVSSIATALKTVIWMWVLLGLVIYTASILFCNELGRQYPDDETMQLYWGTITRSCFSLFQIITLEGWVDIARYIWDKSPAMVCIIVIFITVTTYAIMNVVMAVIVQNVVDRAISSSEDELKRGEKELEEHTLQLMEIFTQADVNKDWELSKQEFCDAVCHNKDTKRILRTLDVDIGDFGTFFDKIDINKDGSLSVKEFVQGIMQMRGGARAQRVFELHCDFAKFASQVESRMKAQDARIIGVQASIDRLTQYMIGETRASSLKGSVYRDSCMSDVSEGDENEGVERQSPSGKKPKTLSFSEDVGGQGEESQMSRMANQKVTIGRQERSPPVLPAANQRLSPKKAESFKMSCIVEDGDDEEEEQSLANVDGEAQEVTKLEKVEEVEKLHLPGQGTSDGHGFHQATYRANLKEPDRRTFGSDTEPSEVSSTSAVESAGSKEVAEPMTTSTTVSGQRPNSGQLPRPNSGQLPRPNSGQRPNSGAPDRANGIIAKEPFSP